MSLKKHIVNWDSDKLVQILRYAREWNTRARNSQIAMTVVRSITAVVPIPTLVKTNEIPEIVAGIIPYAERHFDRLDKLVSNSYTIDYALSCMGGILEEEPDLNWEEKSKFVLPPKEVLDMQKQVNRISDTDVTKDSDNEVVTIGESDSSDSEDFSS